MRARKPLFAIRSSLLAFRSSLLANRRHIAFAENRAEPSNSRSLHSDLKSSVGMTTDLYAEARSEEDLAKSEWRTANSEQRIAQFRTAPGRCTATGRPPAAPRPLAC